MAWRYACVDDVAQAAIAPYKSAADRIIDASVALHIQLRDRPVSTAVKSVVVASEPGLAKLIPLDSGRPKVSMWCERLLAATSVFAPRGVGRCPGRCGGRASSKRRRGRQGCGILCAPPEQLGGLRGWMQTASHLGYQAEGI